MKITQPYRCDYCGKAKGEANHWWLLRSFSPLDSDLFTLFSWDDASAAEEDVEHICSEQCAVKALSKWLASVPQRPADPQAKAWEKAEGK